MSKFILFDAVTNAMAARYDSEIHGERKLTIVDPSWIQPTNDVAVQPGEPFEFDGKSIINDTGKVQIVNDVPDLSIEPVYIEIPNPNCKIPSEAIEVSEATFYKTIEEQDGIWSLVDGAVVKLPFPAPSIGELKAAKRQEINSAFNKAMQAIVGDTPSNEVSSWGKQETEARAYQANHAAITPLIDALASARSVPKDELISRIIAKADLFAHVSGTFIGRRQGLEDDLDALTEIATAEDVAAIAW